MNQHTTKELYNRIENLIPEIKKMLDDKRSLTEIAKYYDFHKDTLCNYLDKKGIRKKRQRKIYFSNDILEYAFKKCKDGSSISSVAKELNINDETLAKDLLQKYSYKSGSDGKKYCNSNYFEKINTKEKAYWLGFFSADGYVNQSTRTIEFCLKDREAIVLFKKALKSQHKISCKDGKYYRVSIKDKKMSEDLLSLNLDNNKTYNYSIPINKIPEKLMSHFLRGYFDGDAYIGISNQNKFVISVTEASNKVMIDIQKILKKELDIDFNIRYNKRNLYVFSIVGKKAQKILEYIYKGSNKEIRLERKYKKYKEFCRLRSTSKRRS
nr:MAG TPA: LAGLIDADG-like domain [Bacteriophage sp.]